MGFQDAIVLSQQALVVRKRGSVIDCCIEIARVSDDRKRVVFPRDA